MGSQRRECAKQLRKHVRCDVSRRGPDGAEYPNESVFVEIVEPERLVFRHLDPVHEFLVTVTFEDLGGATRITWSMLFESAAEYDRVKKFVVEANEQNLDRLEAHLANRR